MKCKECSCCKKGWFKTNPDAYACIGVKEPFVINDIEVDCTEYPEKRNEKVKRKTNFKHIKSMNDEELALFLSEDGWSCHHCSEYKMLYDDSYKDECDEDCYKHCLEWLHKNVGEDV